MADAPRIRTNRFSGSSNSKANSLLKSQYTGSSNSNMTSKVYYDSLPDSEARVLSPPGRKKMSIESERILKLLRECRCEDESPGKSEGISNLEKFRAAFLNDSGVLEKCLSNEKVKMTRNPDFTSPAKPEEKSRVLGGKKKGENVMPKDPKDTLFDDLKLLICDSKWRTASMEYAHLYKMMAICCLERGDELSAINLLSESHAVILQQQIFHRYSKIEIRNQFVEPKSDLGLRPENIEYNPRSIMSCDNFKQKLAEMPEEWYMVQLTVQYSAPDNQRVNGTIVESLCPLHVTILPTGQSAIDPFCITLPKPNNENYDGIREIVNVLRNNKANLEGHYSSNASYWNMRVKQNDTLKIALIELEGSWLREWKILLIADPLKDTSLGRRIIDMIDKLIADDLSVVTVSDRTRWLLRKIATCSCFLSGLEISRAVRYVLHDNPKLANNVIHSINGNLQNIYELRNLERKTMIMIVDESIDHIPFESMDFLKKHPVTRFPSFNIAYGMFKEHKDTIVNGCKIVKKTKKLGAFVVNPEKNLNKMEKRIKLFIEYWLPDWEGNYGVKPSQTSFQKFLLNWELLMYAGHGSGIQYLPGEKIEKLRVRSSVFLFGCSSIKLSPVGGIFPPCGVSNQYLIACSPCILGTLWEVTDMDIDRMTASFISDWIPSDAPRPWSEVDKSHWMEGKLKFTNNTRKELLECTNEPEMLRAVAKSKEMCAQLMTAAAIIVRGLPLRLEA